MLLWYVVENACFLLNGWNAGSNIVFKMLRVCMKMHSIEDEDVIFQCVSIIHPISLTHTHIPLSQAGMLVRARQCILYRRR